MGQLSKEIAAHSKPSNEAERRGDQGERHGSGCAALISQGGGQMSESMIQKVLRKKDEQIDQLTAERDRYRKALERIAKVNTITCGYLTDIAREALEGRQ